MGLYVRTVMPYALPGVLALLACWWFFSRKKDGRNKKISAFADNMDTEDALEELLREEMPRSSRAQPVQLDRKEESILPEDTACCLSLDAIETFLYDKQPVCKVEEGLKDLPIQNVALGPLQATADQEVVEDDRSQSPCANEIIKSMEDTDVCISSVLHTSLVASKSVDDSNTGPEDDEERHPVSSEPPHVYSQGCRVQAYCTKAIDHLNNVVQESESPDMCPQTEALNVMPERELLDKEQNVESCASDINTKDKVSTTAQSEIASVSGEALAFSAKSCHCDPSAIQEVLTSLNAHGQEKLCSQLVDVQTAQTGQIATAKKLDVDSPCDETRAEDEELDMAFKVDVKILETEISKSFPLEQVTKGYALDTCVESSLMEVKGDISHNVEPLMVGDFSDSCMKSIVAVVKEANCTDRADAFSKSGVKEDIENLSLVVDSVKEVNTKTLLGDYEAKIVEQLAINIISKVIVAARQEILSSSTSDASESSLVHKEGNDCLAKDGQSKHLVLEKDDGYVAADLGKSLVSLDYTCESTQTECSQIEELRNGEVNRSSLQENKEKDSVTDTSAHEMPSMSDFSPVHRSTCFFEVSQTAMEDSSISACTSEEGISIDDPLQSTALSTICVGSYDSLSSSGIELSRDVLNVSTDTTKVAAMESKTAVYTNGDVKRGTPDLNSEGPLAAESEADHSGGSDVNSMDSVDSGCALGNSEQFQNMKQTSDVKKADLVIWEFEVPKYLVGRLIGKQGRFVSFLKQTSGAKIYISTVPYTQDIQICHLEGSQQQIDRALGLIRKKFKDLNLTNIFAPPPPLIPLPVASWLSLPNNISVEVVVVNVVNAGHMFVQQRTHPTFHALCGLDHHMSLCYSQSGIPALPTPAEVGILCAAPVGPSVWWRAQVMAYFEDVEEVEILYVDYGGYNRVKIETLRQIRSDFVSLPFQGVEVLLDNVIPLGDDDQFSAEADEAVKELTTGAPMLTQVTNYDEATRLPLVQLWRLNPEEMVSINRTLVERGFAEWIEGY
ncbi:A-kinase anchor protein 1, mitochondrial [Gastrophryne carolinensis]